MRSPRIKRVKGRIFVAPMDAPLTKTSPTPNPTIMGLEDSGERRISQGDKSVLLTPERSAVRREDTYEPGKDRRIH
jgi:hypothetical protein